MSPETGNMSQLTIRQEAERIKEKILEKQSALNESIGDLYDEAFSDVRQDLGYGQPDEIDRTALTNTRVKAIHNAVSIDGLKQTLIPSANSVSTVIQGRRAVENILAGKDDRLLVIAGPCSIHNPEEGLEFADWLVGMRESYGGELEIVMRTYLEKPRSEIGWKGLINDPDLDNTTNISLGLTMGRLFLCQVTDKGLPTALERVDARTTQYFDDLSVYDPIGARDSQTNRARVYLSVTSAVGGVKNPTDGDLNVPVQAVATARAAHTYLGDGDHGQLAEIESTGNETVHVILRGGSRGPNYSAEHVAIVKENLRKKELPEAIVIDASHGNSVNEKGKKELSRQFVVINDVSEQLAMGELAIKGVMIESNLVAGKQELKPGKELLPGVSITDACVDLETTEAMFAVLAGGVHARRASLKARLPN